MDFQKFLGLRQQRRPGMDRLVKRLLHDAASPTLCSGPLPNPSITSISGISLPPLALTLNPADNFDGINGWERFVVLHAVRLVKMKREESTAIVDAGIQDIEAKIDSLSGSRDDGQPSHIIDVEPSLRIRERTGMVVRASTGVGR